jgi:hypothetical protein
MAPARIGRVLAGLQRQLPPSADTTLDRRNLESRQVPDAMDLKQIFGNPIVGVTGSIASVIGVLLAVYFYVQGNRYRDLVYYVSPAKAAVVDTTQTSELRVFLGEREVRGSVSAAQVAVWNAGTESIRPADILKEMAFSTGSEAPILEARIRSSSRDVVGCVIHRRGANGGRCPVVC